jgi:hypothetical protein
MASWYLTRTATQIRREVVGEDEYGSDVYEDVEVTLEDCSWDPRSSLGGEDVDARNQVVDGMMLFCGDPDADIKPTDAFRLDGVEYEVDGEVARYRQTRMGQDGVAVALKRVSG